MWTALSSTNLFLQHEIEVQLQDDKTSLFPINIYQKYLCRTCPEVCDKSKDIANIARKPKITLSS
jgi:hypothetical protein